MEIGADLLAGEGMARLASVGECRFPVVRQSYIVLYGGANPKRRCYERDWAVSGEWFERVAGRTGRQEGDAFNAPFV